MAEALGIESEPRSASRKVRVLGGVYPARLATVSLTLAPFEDITWEAEVMVLAADLDLPFAGCLGSQGFLDRWVVTFNYYDSYFVVEERDAFVARIPIDVVTEYQEKFDQDWWPPGV